MPTASGPSLAGSISMRRLSASPRGAMEEDPDDRVTRMIGRHGEWRREPQRHLGFAEQLVRVSEGLVVARIQPENADAHGGHSFRAVDLVDSKRLAESPRSPEHRRARPGRSETPIRGVSATPFPPWWPGGSGRGTAERAQVARPERVRVEKDPFKPSLDSCTRGRNVTPDSTAPAGTRTPEGSIPTGCRRPRPCRRRSSRGGNP